MRFTEFFQVLPTLLFSMVIVALFGASLPLSPSPSASSSGPPSPASRGPSSCASASWNTSWRRGPPVPATSS